MDETTSTTQSAGEIAGTWKGRRRAEVWRLARGLAGQRSGPKKRRFDAASPLAPSMEEVRTHFSGPGHDGGFEAVP
eukprot:2918742-Pyramimonas_sp.AAC.1